MNLPTLKTDRYDASDKYHEYAAAAKQESGYFKQKNAWYKDLKKLYYQMKIGKKVVDVPAVMKMAGLHDNGTPKMAIAEMTAPHIICRMEMTGRVTFTHNDSSWNWKPQKRDIDIEHCFPTFPYGKYNANHFRLQAPVPLVPPQFVPKTPMADLYILWEVEQWKMIAPIDPWLLKRITDSHFILLNGWNLTELERSVMNAHI